MKKFPTIITLFILLLFFNSPSNLYSQTPTIAFDFGGQQFSFSGEKVIGYSLKLTNADLNLFYDENIKGNYIEVIKALKQYKKRYSPDDWLFYQLIRKTAEQISPKKSNYYQYTLFKWYLLNSCGYDSRIKISDEKMLFYIQCDENIYNIPNYIKDNTQFVCLNFHDYGQIDFTKENFHETNLPIAENASSFSYKVTHIPDFKAAEYLEKDIHFTYNENDYHFKVKLSTQLHKMFTNYPVVDYESNFNIPLSRETYNSLIPQLKRNIKGMKVKSGVDYLMRFTRYAFIFETDNKNFGSEKRLSPEQTLFYNQSDCEDRVALFFYLVKEIYDLPMIVLAYPSHVTIAVGFDKPVGQTINYQGRFYSVCEPTPQKQDLQVGQLLPELTKTPFQVAYAYNPLRK